MDLRQFFFSGFITTYIETRSLQPTLKSNASGH